MQRCDVAIVGGGPAGSSCAWLLTRAGLDVLVIDRADFPRDKVCAGWITPAVVKALALSLSEYAKEHVLQPIRGFRLGMLGERPADVRSSQVISYGIRRCEFDHFLLARTGARLRLGQPLRSLARDGIGWVLDDEIRADLVVGAGGHFCPVARHLSHAGAPQEPIVAAREMEVQLAGAALDEDGVSRERPELFFERDLAGYGWIVRKGDWINVGLGRQGAQDLNTHLERFTNELQQRGKLPRPLPGRFRGHAYLLHGQGRRRPSHSAACLVGDALGLAYARSGEGIRPAVESGLLAAQAILGAGGRYTAEQLSVYDAALRARFGTGTPPSTGPSLWIPAFARAWVAARLLGNVGFARHVVIDRWFLHRDQPPLSPERAFGPYA